MKKIKINKISKYQNLNLNNLQVNILKSIFKILNKKNNNYKLNKKKKSKK